MTAIYAVTASVMFSRANVEAGIPSMVLTGDAGDVFQDSIQEIGFAAQEALELGVAGAGGWMCVQNLDATNFVELARVNAEDPFAKLLPSMFALFPLHSGAVPVAKADTAACKVRVLVLEAAP